MFISTRSRAGLSGKKEGLLGFRWSSLPSYLAWPSQRPPWLEVSRVLGELGLDDGAKDRRAYGERLEERAEEGMEEETLGQLRRGWILGGEAFRDRILDWMESKPGGRKLRREEADAEHGQRQAERIIGRMLEGLKMSEREVMAARKGDWRKRVIAQRVREETSVSLRWLGARLGMGSEGHVSRVSGSIEDLASHPGWRFFRVSENDAKKRPHLSAHFEGRPVSISCPLLVSRALNG